jgi:hypothetical protein
LYHAGGGKEEPEHEDGDVGGLLGREADREQAEQRSGLPPARLVVEAEQHDDQSERDRRDEDVLPGEAGEVEVGR